MERGARTSPEARNAEKQSRWESIEHEVDTMQDALGMEVDEGIKSLVVALRTNGFGTRGSCEGHLGRGAPYPWVDVVALFSEKISKDTRYRELNKKAHVHDEHQMPESEQRELVQMVRAQIEANKEECERLQRILDRFYAVRSNTDAPDGFRLIINKGPWNQSRIQPEGVPRFGSKIELLPENTENEAQLKRYRDEAREFMEFLKGKFFAEVS